jgi:hypothetical protein
MAMNQPAQHDALVRLAGQLQRQLEEFAPAAAVRDADTLSAVAGEWRLAEGSLWTSGIVNKASALPKAAHLEDLALECHWTSLGSRLPVIRGLVDELCGVYGWKGLERVRLLKMGAKTGGARLSRHTDIGDKAAGLRDGQIARFHIPLLTHRDAKMTIWDLDGTSTAHQLPAFTCWYLDARKPHAVANLSPLDRVHLVVDVVADAGLRSLLADTYRGQS